MVCGRNAAEVRRNPEGTADVGAELEGDISGCERRRRAARGSAGGPAEIPGIVGRAVDFVERLPVAEKQRHVGLADHDRAGGLEPAHQHRVFGGAPIRAAGDPQVVGNPATL